MWITSRSERSREGLLPQSRRAETDERDDHRARQRNEQNVINIQTGSFDHDVSRGDPDND